MTTITLELKPGTNGACILFAPPLFIIMTWYRATVRLLNSRPNLMNKRSSLASKDSNCLVRGSSVSPSGLARKAQIFLGILQNDAGIFLVFE